ncbi:MAG: hypothetical protein LBH85_07865, partial [Treponema sp.]|nr:hypothetical protein [Treponema sp.]
MSVAIAGAGEANLILTRRFPWSGFMERLPCLYAAFTRILRVPHTPFLLNSPQIMLIALIILFLFQSVQSVDNLRRFDRLSARSASA